MPRASHANPDVALSMLASTKQPGGPGWGRHWKRRLTVLLIIQALIIVHIIVWWIGVPRGWLTVAPVEPSEAIETVSEGVINAGFIFFVLAMISTAIFGRWFCGWGCHVMLLQDLCLRFMRRLGIRPRAFKSRLLLWAPLVLALYMFVWPIFYRVAIAPFTRPDLHWPGFSVEILTSDLWATMPGVGVAIVFLLVCGFATVYVLGGKGFCTYACPYGGFFAPLDRIAPRRVRVTDACEGCAMCTAVCTSNVRVHEQVAAYGMVTDPGCMKTTDCIEACPKQALYIGWGSTARGAHLREGATAPRPKWDLTWTGEIALGALMLGFFLAWRGAYGLVPVLMAIGTAAVLTWLVWKAMGVLRSENAAFHRWRLKIGGKVRPSGVVFLLVAGVATLLSLQAVASQVSSIRGGQLSDGLRTGISSPPVPGVATIAQQDARRAKAALAAYRFGGSVLHGGIGLATDPNDLLAMARLNAGLGHTRQAQSQLARVASISRPNETVAMERFMIAVAIDLPVQVLAWTRAELDAHPDWTRLASIAAQWAAAQGDFGTAASLAMGPDRDKYEALAALQIGDLSNGRLALDRFLAAVPNDALAWIMLAEVRLALGDVAGADAAAGTAQTHREALVPAAQIDFDRALAAFSGARAARPEISPR